MDDFITIYKQDYKKRAIKKTEPFSDQQQFADPLGEAYKNYLSLTDECVEPVERVEDYLDKFKERNKKIANIYFKEPIDKEGIYENIKSNMKTVYQVDFAAAAKGLAKDKCKSEIQLPSDWDIPYTTQKIDYRDPILLNKNVFKESAGKMFRPTTNLDKFKSIKTSIDKTTYQEDISKLGGIIVEKQLHGKIVYPHCSCAKHNIKNINN